MQVSLKIQKDGLNAIVNAVGQSIEESPKKIYIYAGILKEAGFNIIEEYLIDLKSQITFVIGIDKKNTTKNLLDSMLKYTKDVYVYNNNQVVEMDSNIYVFEYSKKATVILASGNLSEGGIRENFSYYTMLEFDLNNQLDKDEYKKYIKALGSELESDKFVKLNKEYIEKLVSNKEIFSTKQYVHTVKSISELLGKNKLEEEKTTKKENDGGSLDDVYYGSAVIPRVNLEEEKFDIEIPEISIDEVIKITEVEKPKTSRKKQEEEIVYDDSINENIDNEYSQAEAMKDNNKNDYIDKDSEMYDPELEKIDFDESSTLDIENLLFSKADVKLNKSRTKIIDKNSDLNVEKVEDKEEKLKIKKIDLSNVSNFIMELEAKALKGQETTIIKIPNYIQETIPNFFELIDKGKNIEINGQKIKQRDIEIEIVDVKNNSKYVDRKAKISHKKGQSFIYFESEILKDILFNASDIARIIKLSSNIYHIEIIPQDMQEYKLWSKLCNQKFKSTTRKYGVM
ncbi:MAG: hypothetical protein N2749_04675 [Clostridia bacterium]|nr:hypothetical protein [Clostridia bacterium]